MFDHVTIRVSDRDASERFYETVLATLGIEQTHNGEQYAEWSDFSLASADEQAPVTRGLHIAFVAPSRMHADEFWRVGTAAGYRSDGRPGPRPQYGDDYYGAFLLDPDGNSAEAVHRSEMRAGGVDHLWIRVADVDAAKRFYETVAPHAGFRLRRHTAERAQFVGETGTFSVVAGQPTEAVHVAFPAGGDATVAAFHRAATQAGYRDNGAPGERPVYHAGYYAAYVLDPDRSNVLVILRLRGRAAAERVDAAASPPPTEADGPGPVTTASRFPSGDQAGNRPRTRRRRSRPSIPTIQIHPPAP